MGDGSTKTMCARAVEPTAAQVRPPVHCGLGELEVKDMASLASRPATWGTKEVFYDITKAEKEGHFGPDPVIWKAQEMHFALGMLASALDLEGKAWEDRVYHPTKWSDEGIERATPSKMHMDGLKTLRDTKRNPSALTAHFVSQPSFSARGGAPKATDTTSNSSTAGGSADAPHMVVAVEMIKSFTNDGLAQAGAKKPRLEPTATQEEMTALEAATKAAKLDKRRAAKNANMLKKKADAEMETCDEEYSLASM